MDWQSVQVPAALIAGCVALVTSGIAAAVTIRAAASRAKVDRDLAILQRRFNEELAEQKVRLENKAIFAAEEAAVRFLNFEGYPSRSFHFIRHRLRGFDDSELRQILVRSGAVQFTGEAGEERWGLWERNKQLVQRTPKEETDLGQAPPDQGYRSPSEGYNSPGAAYRSSTEE